MSGLIWGGTALSLLGLLGLLWCIRSVAKAKKHAQSDEELRATLAKMIPANLAALLLSVLGLMLVVVGVFLAP